MSKYRILKPNELLREGDEYQDPNNRKWYKTHDAGKPVCHSVLPLKYRRIVRQQVAA